MKVSRYYLAICPHCNEKILCDDDVYRGDYYVEYDGEYYHDECLSDFIKEYIKAERKEARR